MQASNTPPHHPPGVAFPTWNPAGKVERKSNRFESRMNFSASGIPGGAFFMHFCAFVPLPEFNTRCSVNSMFAKSLFSEICTQKTHFAHLGRPGEHPPGRKVLRSGCAVLHLAAKVERV